MKDIVTEDPNNFDVGLIIPLIREKIYSRNPYVREFLVAWVRNSAVFNKARSQREPRGMKQVEINY